MSYNVYQELWEKSAVTSHNMAYLIGYYNSKLYGAVAGYNKREDIEAALELAEFIWNKRDERRWDLDSAKAALTEEKRQAAEQKQNESI